MKLTMIQAPNMRKAMSRVQTEMGSDAIIYRTREYAGGIEILAGIPEIEAQNTEINLGEPESLVEMNQPHFSRQITQFNRVLDDLSNKIAQLCDVGQFSPMKKPVAAAFHAQFKKLGFSNDVIEQVFSSFINKQRVEYNASEKVLDEIIHSVPLVKEDVITQRNIIACIGLTGVGKTTTLIKMAVRFLERNEANELLIISTDVEDLTTKNKLGHFCQFSHVAYEYAQSGRELNEIIAKNIDKKLILIDTHGVSQNDEAGLQHLQSFFTSCITPVSVYAVLACHLQEKVMQEMIIRFGFDNLSGCILTKLDEASLITPALSISIIHKLPIAYLCDGQDIDTHITVPDRKKIYESMPIIFDTDHTYVERVKSSRMSNILKQLSFGYYGC